MTAPATITPERIRELCEAWASAVRLPGGGFGIGGNSEQFRLLRNGIVFHALDFETLTESSLGLGHNLLLPGLTTIIDLDHQFLWSWCAEFLLFDRPPLFPGPDRALGELLGTCARAALANSRRPPSSKGEWEQQRDTDQYIPFHLRQLGVDAGLVLAYLSFPLLEAVIKSVANKYVAPDGTVRHDFSVPRKSSGARTYTKGAKCSSLQDLLSLLLHQVASPALATALAQVRTHLQGLDASQEPFDLLYAWRNSSLHEAASYPTIGSTVFNIALLILLDQYAESYSTRREAVWEKVRWELQTSSRSRSPWSYYPPF